MFKVTGKERELSLYERDLLLTLDLPNELKSYLLSVEVQSRNSSHPSEPSEVTTEYYIDVILSKEQKQVIRDAADLEKQTNIYAEIKKINELREIIEYKLF